jgi:hypothetical protein
MFKRTFTPFWKKTSRIAMTVIEIRPYRNGWKVFEAPGVEPVFLEKEQAINYAENRASLMLASRRLTFMKTIA